MVMDPLLFNGTVVLENDACGKFMSFQQLQVHTFTGRKDPLARAENEGVDMQCVFIDKVVFHERVDQDTAAIHEDILTGLILQFFDFSEHIFIYQGRIPPERRRFQSRRADELCHGVHGLAKRITFGHGIEGFAVLLPGPAPEKKRIRLSHRFEEIGSNIIMPVRQRPASVYEAAVGIFIRGTRRLTSAVLMSVLLLLSVEPARAAYFKYLFFAEPHRRRARNVKPDD